MHKLVMHFLTVPYVIRNNKIWCSLCPRATVLSPNKIISGDQSQLVTLTYQKILTKLQQNPLGGSGYIFVLLCTMGINQNIYNSNSNSIVSKKVISGDQSQLVTLTYQNILTKFQQN